MAKQTQWHYPESRILVFAKAPQPGQVKTRLAKAVGEDTAARMYSSWLETIVKRLAAARLAPLELWISPDAEHPLFQSLAENCHVELRIQPVGNLGQRMQQVMLQTLASHRQAVLIGSDCPVMQVDYVERALRALDQGIGTVIGPAEDGGYVLLGLRQVVPALFDAVPWSTGRVMRTTRQQLIAAGQHWAELETLWDIDGLEDYRRWQKLSQNLSQRAFDQADIEVKTQ
jgi:rSAM/selenodomain-associated transferase 1